MSNYILNMAGSTAPVAVYTKQGDRCYAIEFDIYNGSAPYDLTGCTVMINLEKPDGHTYIGIARIIAETDGKIEVNLDYERQMTAAAGEGILELEIIKGGLIQGTANARWIVQESPGGELVSGTVFNSIVELAGNVVGYVSEVQQAVQDSAQALSEAEEAAEAAASSANEARFITLNNIRDIIYPVGSIVHYADATIDPNTLIGGTWERIQGRFLFAADDSHAAGTEGGSETVTLTTDNMPRHMHYVIRMASGTTSPDYLHSVARTDRKNSQWSDCHYQLYGVDQEANAGRSSYAGSGTAHNNMPPYLSICIWKRTA